MKLTMKHSYIITFIFLALVFMSCEDKFSQVVEFDLPEHEPVLVSYCMVDVNSSEIILQLSKSATIDNEESTNINQADIHILKDGNQFISAFTQDSIFAGFDYSNPEKMDSIFSKRFIAELPSSFEHSSVYELEISSPGFEDVFSNSSVPTKVEISEIHYEKDGFIDPEGYTTDELEIRFTDPGSEENFYAISATVDFDFGGESYSRGLYLDGFDPRFETSWDIALLPDLYNQYIYFEDKEGFDGKENIIKLSADLYDLDNENADATLHVVLYSISKEFFAFIHATQLYNNNNGNFFAEPIIIPSNITNGFGVFGFFTSHEMTIQL